MRDIEKICEDGGGEGKEKASASGRVAPRASPLGARANARLASLPSLFSSSRPSDRYLSLLVEHVVQVSFALCNYAIPPKLTNESAPTAPTVCRLDVAVSSSRRPGNRMECKLVLRINPAVLILTLSSSRHRVERAIPKHLSGVVRRANILAQPQIRTASHATLRASPQQLLSGIQHGQLSASKPPKRPMTSSFTSRRDLYEGRR